jgi:hypothetical protein
MATAITAGSCKTVWADSCPTFYLKTDDGKIINPLTGQNADQPYSTRETCGACHDYKRISKGYHFQQDWDVASDDFDKNAPWRLSPGMAGGF